MGRFMRRVTAFSDVFDHTVDCRFVVMRLTCTESSLRFKLICFKTKGRTTLQNSKGCTLKCFSFEITLITFYNFLSWKSAIPRNQTPLWGKSSLQLQIAVPQPGWWKQILFKIHVESISLTFMATNDCCCKREETTNFHAKTLQMMPTEDECIDSNSLSGQGWEKHPDEVEQEKEKR